jgi:hypothetical protein
MHKTEKWLKVKNRTPFVELKQSRLDDYGRCIENWEIYGFV